MIEIMKNYNLFLSHAWKPSQNYDKLTKMLNSDAFFSWRNYSETTHNPLINPDTPTGKQDLSNTLRQQIKPVDCVLILTCMCIDHCDWVEKQIGIAKQYEKPIIGIYATEQERMPLVVMNHADELVSWDAKHIVNAIEKHTIKKTIDVPLNVVV